MAITGVSTSVDILVSLEANPKAIEVMRKENLMKNKDFIFIIQKINKNDEEDPSKMYV